MTELQYSAAARNPQNNWPIDALVMSTRLKVLAGIVKQGGGSYSAIQKGLTFLGADQELRLYAPAIIFDIDETIIKGSCEHLHDGPDGRFARALSMLLEVHGKVFNREDWATYRRLTGKTEKLVCEDICRLAEKEYGAKLDPEVYRLLARQIVLDDLASFTATLAPVKGVTRLLKRFHAAGSPLVTCSCGDHLIMNAVMRHFRLTSFFEIVLGSADKRTSNGFSGRSVSDVAHYMHRAGRSCVMFGDSISDVGAAVRAGLPLVVVRLPDQSPETIAKFQADYEQMQKRYPRTTRRTEVLVIQDYDQVKAVPAESMLAVSYEPGLPDEALASRKVA